MVGEAAFALLYFQRATDLIPDSIPGMGLLDDAMIVRIVLGRHEPAFKFSPHGYKLQVASDRWHLVVFINPKFNRLYLIVIRPCSSHDFP